MSAFDFTARAMAMRAAALTPICFAELGQVRLPASVSRIASTGCEVPGVGPGEYVADDFADAALAAAHPRFCKADAAGRHFRLLPVNGEVHGHQGGMRGDGTDDGPAMRAGVAYATLFGARFVLSPRTYVIRHIPHAEHDYNIGPQPNVVVPHDCREIDGRGATLRMTNGGRGLYASNIQYPNVHVWSDVTGDIAAGSFVIPVADGTKFAVGDKVCWQLGEIPYDKPETTNWGHARVLSVAGNNVTIDRPITEAFVLASVTTGKKRLVRLPPFTPLTIRNLKFDGQIDATLGSESAIDVRYRTDVTIENVHGRYCGAGVIVAQYVERMRVVGCTADSVNTTQLSYGVHLSFAECRAVEIVGGGAKAMKMGLRVEADAEVHVDGYAFENTFPGNGSTPAPNTVFLFQVQGKSKVVANNTLVTGMGGLNLANTSNGLAEWDGMVQFTGETRVRTAAAPFNIGLARMSGMLDYQVAGVRQRYNLDRRQTWQRRFRLKDGMAGVNSYGRPGMVVAARVYTSPGVVLGAGGLTHFYFGKTSNAGPNFAVGGVGGVTLIPGSWVELPIQGGTVNMTWAYRDENNRVAISTAAAAGLDAKDEFLLLELDYVTDENSKTFAYAEGHLRGEGGDYETYEALVRNVDLASIAAGATGTATLAIPDMANTDIFVGFGIDGGYGGLELVKFEPQTGQGVATFRNTTGAAINLTARDMRVVFAKGQTGA
jgi:hypothetical protein